MTYILGYKSKKCTYLTGDFALTRTGRNISLREEYSSFGEKHILRGEGGKQYTVEEAMLKIFPVSVNVAVGFAGDVGFAVSIIENFSLLINDQHPTTVQKLINLLIQSINTSMPSHLSAHFVVGGILKDSPFLFAVESHSMVIQENTEFIHVGSIANSSVPTSAEQIIAPLLQANDVDKEILICSNAVIQSILLHERSIQQGVGGLFLGLQISNEGIQWQKDTSYILYDSGFRNFTMINMVVRDNVVALSSPYTQDGKRFFTTTTAQVNISKWWSEWSESVNRVLNDSLMDYYVFLSTEYMLIVIVRQIKNMNNELIVINKTAGRNRISFGLSPDVQKAILMKPQVRKETDGGIPLRLQWF